MIPEQQNGYIKTNGADRHDQLRLFSYLFNLSLKLAYVCTYVCSNIFIIRAKHRKSRTMNSKDLFFVEKFFLVPTNKKKSHPGKDGTCGNLFFGLESDS